MARISKLLAETWTADSNLSLYKSRTKWTAVVGSPKSRGQFHFEATGMGDTAASALDRAAEAIAIVRREGEQTVVVDGSGVYRS